MSGEDQERFEDYLELERYLRELQAGRTAHPPDKLTPEQARIYRMAALFRSASPAEAEPRPEFVADLKARLEEELLEPTLPLQAIKATERRGGPEKVPRETPEHARVSRRSLLTGSAAVAASLVVGAGIERVSDNMTKASPPLVVETTPKPVPTVSYNTALVGNPAAAAWHFVTTLGELGKDAFRFATDAVVGYVIFNNKDSDDTDPDAGKIIAFSAACTHMGCIVQWQGNGRKFQCPCHGGTFTEYGKVDMTATATRYLASLPRLDVKVEGDKIYVRVPTSHA